MFGRWLWGLVYVIQETVVDGSCGVQSQWNMIYHNIFHKYTIQYFDHIHIKHHLFDVTCKIWMWYSKGNQSWENFEKSGSSPIHSWLIMNCSRRLLDTMLVSHLSELLREGKLVMLNVGEMTLGPCLFHQGNCCHSPMHQLIEAGWHVCASVD